MKEFTSQDGGRYTFVDDVLNLQELALAITHIFHDCENFVLWGCHLTGDRVSEGYVYLNGKLRHFHGGSCIADTQGNRYIIENNTVEPVPYATGGSKDGRTNYGTALTNTCISQGGAAQYITISPTGKCLRFRDAFFGLYSMLLDPASGQQTVKGKASFEEVINAQRGLISSGPIEITTSAGEFKLLFEENIFKILTKTGGRTYSVQFSEANGIEVFNATTRLMSVSPQGAVTFVSISVPQAILGDLAIKQAALYNSSTPDHDGVVEINMVGYNGTQEYHRKTVIGDGRGVPMFSVDGAANAVSVSAWHFFVKTHATAGIVLLGNMPKTAKAYTKTITWRDCDNETLGYIGYTSEENYTFQFKNTIGAIQIEGLDAVDIYPVIKEGGKLLSEKYVLATTFTTELDKKVSSNNVYDKNAADTRFARISAGFAQFTSKTTSQALRQQIGAFGADDLTDYPQISSYLADMAKTEEDKTRICENIGAAKASEYQPKLKDTGWKRIGTTDLYARQIGAIVSIQGTFVSKHDNEVQFSLPNEIEPPRHTATYSYPEWTGVIKTRERDCVVFRCRNHGVTLPFTLTYLT